MTRQVWPFCPIVPMLEAQQWSTDVLRAKGSENRIRLRSRPRRTFNFNHVLTTVETRFAQQLLRANQGADGFYIPDWSQFDQLEPITAGGSAQSLSLDGEEVFYGDGAVVWDSVSRYEYVTGAVDSNGYFVTDALVNSYDSPKIMPAWIGDAPAQASFDSIGANFVTMGLEFVTNSTPDIGESSYSTYRGLAVSPDCPTIVGGLQSGLSQDLTIFDNQVTDVAYIRQRNLGEFTFNISWIKNTRRDLHLVRKFINSRYGRQKSFWVSSFVPDFTIAANASGTTLTVFAESVPISSFFIQAKDRSGNLYNRQVTAVATGTPVNGRATVDLTLDATLTLAVADTARISFLFCCRFAADRIEFAHETGAVTSVRVPCLEVPEP